MTHSVLIIEDDPDLVGLYRAVLATLNVKIAEARSSDQAIQMMKETGAPDLVILDIEMPGAPGSYVVSHIRATPELRNTRIIVVTANDTYAKRLEGQVDEFMQKPVAIPILMQRIGELLGVN